MFGFSVAALIAAATYGWAGLTSFFDERERGSSIAKALAYAALWPVRVFTLLKSRL